MFVISFVAALLIVHGVIPVRVSPRQAALLCIGIACGAAAVIVAIVLILNVPGVAIVLPGLYCIVELTGPSLVRLSDRRRYHRKSDEGPR